MASPLPYKQHPETKYSDRKHLHVDGLSEVGRQLNSRVFSLTRSPSRRQESEKAFVSLITQSDTLKNSDLAIVQVLHQHISRVQLNIAANQTPEINRLRAAMYQAAQHLRTAGRSITNAAFIELLLEESCPTPDRIAMLFINSYTEVANQWHESGFRRLYGNNKNYETLGLNAIGRIHYACHLGLRLEQSKGHLCYSTIPLHRLIEHSLDKLSSPDGLTPAVAYGIASNLIFPSASRGLCENGHAVSMDIAAALLEEKSLPQQFSNQCPRTFQRLKTRLIYDGLSGIEPQ